LIQTAGPNPVSVEATQIKVRAYPNRERQNILVQIEALDSIVGKNNDQTKRGSGFMREITVPMPPAIDALGNRPISAYVTGSQSDADNLMIERERYKLVNSVVSELHARMSFALSCLILVMVGCALGMMFRSGNFLSAFAVSVIPALMCIALIVTGQHTAENVPSPLPPNWHNSLELGKALIWSGNAIVLVIAVVLLGRLQRR
jgi:hypothetical protein